MRAIRRLSAVVVVAVLAIGLGGCGKSKSKAASPGSGTTLEAYDFRFDPKTLDVKVGQRVTLAFKNEGKAEHTFTVSSLSVDEEAEGGATKTVTFTAPASAGDVQFFCRYHRDSKSMVGTLHVST